MHFMLPRAAGERGPSSHSVLEICGAADEFGKQGRDARRSAGPG